MIADGDDSGMSEADSIACQKGIEELSKDFDLVPASDWFPGSFSRNLCECCDALAGDREELQLLPKREDQLG